MVKKMKSLILQNAAGEGPGIISGFLDKGGWEWETIHLYAGDAIPSDWLKYDLFVIMGGPMNVYEEEVFPYLNPETSLISEAIEIGLPVLGFCLGAQLMAKAHGAKVIKGHEKEIGWYPMTLAKGGISDPLLKSFPTEFPVFQWHEDTFDLPEGAVRLAFSEAYPNQAIRIGSVSYGFQFHFEITKEMIISWLNSASQEDESLVNDFSIEKVLRETENYIDEAHSLCSLFFTPYLKMIEKILRNHPS